MHLHSKPTLGHDRVHQSFEGFMTGLRERFGQAEDWAADVADRTENFTVREWSWVTARPHVFRWVIVVGCVAASTIVGLAFGMNVTTASQMLLLLPAVLISAIYGGVYAGAIASLLGAMAAIKFKMTPVNGSLEPDVVALVLYAVACGIVIGLSRAQQNQRTQIMLFAETLEGKIQERTTDLEEANRELSDFCYSISHDIRAPMRNIVGSSRILLEESGDQLDAEAKSRLSGLASSAIKLSSWVDDLLNHARLNHTELKPEWINLTGMIDEMCDQLKTEPWQFEEMKVHVQPNLTVTGDRVLVKLAARCLLENACKYVRPGQVLLIEVGERRIGKRTFIFVRDNGIGFEAQYAKKIFEPFQRLHRDEDYAGTGIGLANVRRIVERHGGEVFAESMPGEGATFYFRLGVGKSSR